VGEQRRNTSVTERRRRKRVLLIDGDILVYQVASAAEKPYDWGDDLWTLHSDMNEALPAFEQRIEDLRTELQADHIIFALTTMGKNFRKDVYPKYKSNRKAVRKPLVWKPLREHLHANYEVFERDGLEGDDCLGILATKAGTISTKVGVGWERILVSIDKDFKTIPCTYYHMQKREMLTITEAEADRWFMFQTLTGDTTDGYPGCPGIGPKNAERILEVVEPVVMSQCVDVADCHSKNLAALWRAVVATYKAKGLGEGVALQMARCARILRSGDYDFKNKKPILWTPEGL
jgi:DNA polymerase-1